MPPSASVGWSARSRAGSLVLRRGLGMPLLIGAVVMGLGHDRTWSDERPAHCARRDRRLAAGALIIDVSARRSSSGWFPTSFVAVAMGVLMAFTTLTAVAGAIALPVLADDGRPLRVPRGDGIAAIVFTTIGLVLIGTAADRAATPYEATIAASSELPLFAGVPSARLEAAMHKVVEVPVKAGEVVVQQGEPADRFYIIEVGAFTVSQAPCSRCAARGPSHARAGRRLRRARAAQPDPAHGDGHRRHGRSRAGPRAQMTSLPSWAPAVHFAAGCRASMSAAGRARARQADER